jgi:hypothetical protein
MEQLMTGRELEEYKALRATIRERGTARTWVFVAGLAAWAALAAASTLVPVPLVAVIPLVLLAGVFEAVFALHVAVERIGRYLDVFFEDRWEQTALAFGVPLGGTGADPLFVVVFALATLCNFVPVLLAEPVTVELVAIGGGHMIFLLRLAIARRSTARQRPADRARFEQMRDAAPRRMP